MLAALQVVQVCADFWCVCTTYLTLFCTSLYRRVPLGVGVMHTGVREYMTGTKWYKVVQVIAYKVVQRYNPYRGYRVPVAQVDLGTSREPPRTIRQRLHLPVGTSGHNCPEHATVGHEVAPTCKHKPPQVRHLPRVQLTQQ